MVDGRVLLMRGAASHQPVTGYGIKRGGPSQALCGTVYRAAVVWFGTFRRYMMMG